MNSAKPLPAIDELTKEYQRFSQSGLSLNLTRGKPSPEQLDLSAPLLSLPGHDVTDQSGNDCRNYGGIDGLEEMKALFAAILEVDPHNIIVGWQFQFDTDV